MDKGRAKSAMATAPAVACMKTLLMVFNFIFWITGIAILALGIWTKVDLYRYMELSSIYYKESPFILIGVGAIIVLVGSLGCCCTVKGNSVLLYLYAFFLLIVFVIELSAGIAGFVYKGKLQEGFSEGLSNALTKYGKDSFVSESFDGLQAQLKCCGNTGYIDWFNTPWQKSQANLSVPTSCCKEGIANCKSTGLSVGSNVTDINTKGCYATVVDFMEKNLGLIGGVALGISFIQILGAALAYCLAKNINKSKYEQVA